MTRQERENRRSQRERRGNCKSSARQTRGTKGERERRTRREQRGGGGGRGLPTAVISEERQRTVGSSSRSRPRGRLTSPDSHHRGDDGRYRIVYVHYDRGPGFGVDDVASSELIRCKQTNSTW